MKKIGIVTMFGLFNYGNRLQNYAMQQVLQKKGFDVSSIVLKEDSKKYNSSFRNIAKWLLTKVINNKNTYHIKRGLSFVQFQKHIKTHIVHDLKFIEEYDFFVTGSDQVWNPGVINDMYLLKFASDNKKIAISASIGTDILPEEKKEYYREIGSIKNISVREESGKKILKELINKEIDVLVDPTFMLRQEEWDLVSKEIDNLPKDFILVNFLGDVTEEYANNIKKIAEKYRLDVIDINDKNSSFFTSGPSEFLGLIKKCKLVCTDSFHSVVFSLIYKKDYIVFERKDKDRDMFTRLKCLLEKFGQEDRMAENVNDNEIFECRFNHVEEILYKERKKFDDFINKAFTK